MTDFHGLALGTPANLLKGYGPGWDPAAGQLDILPRPNAQPMTPQPIVTGDQRGEWPYPIITLHETVQSLVTALLGYTVESPAIDQAPPSLPAGAMLLSSPQGQAARQKLAGAIGVSLDDADLRYALVKLTRVDQQLHHTTKAMGILTTVNALEPDPEIDVNSEFMRDLARLRHFEGHRPEHDIAKLTPKDANGYLSLFAQWGTHFVSSVTVGDQIAQVFAYRADRFKEVKKAFNNRGNDFSGINAGNFAYFTTDANTGHYGYVYQYGKILCLSNGEAFRQDLTNGRWHENVWAKKDSIFQLFADNPGEPLAQSIERYTDKAPVEITLAPLTTFTEYKRTAIWRRVLKAALSTVFGDSINPNFTPQDTTDFAKLIPEDQPGLISAIATPTINVYKTRLDLAGMELVAPEEVQKFITFGYVVSIAGKDAIALPGSTVNLFGYILDARKTGGAPAVITLSAVGYAALAIRCARFLGAARFQTADNSKSFLVSDGLRYERKADGTPTVTADVRQPPGSEHLSELKNSLEFSLAFGEAVLGLQSGDRGDSPVQELARDFLRWLGRTIPAETQDPELLAMRVRALDLSSYSPNAGSGAFVPILPAFEYEDATQKILDVLQETQRQIQQNRHDIEQRKLAERTIEDIKTLNKNIVQSGKLLTGLIKANAQSADDLSKHYDAIIKARTKEKHRQQGQINELEKAVFEQQHNVDEAVEAYKQAIADKEIDDVINLGISVATRTFDPANDILIPVLDNEKAKGLGAKAEAILAQARALGSTAQRVNKTLHALDATGKLYSRKGSIGDAQKKLDRLDGGGFGDTTTIEWDEMSDQLEAVLWIKIKGDGVNDAKVNLVTAFKILVIRGKALTSAKSTLHQIQRDIYATQTQKKLSERQRQRLEELTGKLKPAKIEDLDKAKIDLVGLTGSLEYLHRQMLTTFAKTFLLQDQALQYQWLQEPTPIASYSVLTLLRSRAAQKGATIEAKSSLLQHQTSTTRPITVDIDCVRTEEIINGNAFQIIIGADNPAFSPYVNLRVVGVVAEVIGIKKTKSHKYHVKLVFEDEAFSDRDIERNVLRFNTPWRERTYEYEFKKEEGEAKEKWNRNFIDEGTSWSDGVSRVTPLGSWLVSLPSTRTNDGLSFNGIAVTVRLTFILDARIVDAKALARSPAPRAELPRNRIVALGGTGSETDLISDLFKAKDPTNGWDVVFNMGLSQINDALKDQYEELKHKTTYKNIIDVTTKRERRHNNWEIRKFYMEYGYPRLHFAANNDSAVQLEMEIEKGSLTVCDQKGSGPLDCDPPKSIAGKTLKAYVALSKVEGKATIDGKEHHTLKVEIDMAKGAFDVSDIEIDDEEKVELNKAIKAYFSQHRVVYLINQLDLTDVPVIEALRPNGFRFKVLRTKKNVDILQLFIQTENRSLLNPTQRHLNSVPEPLPLGATASIIIRNELFFSEVLPNSMHKSKWTMKGSQDEKSKLWYGLFTDAPISAHNVDLSGLNQTGVDIGAGWSADIKYSLPNNTLKSNLKGMTLKPRSDGQMDLSGKNTQSVTINKDTDEYYTSSFYTKHNKSHEEFKNDVGWEVKAIAPAVIKEEKDQKGPDRQKISIAMQNQSVHVATKVGGGGPSGSKNLQERVNKEARERVEPQIKEQLNVEFDAISLFAIRNLLFPSNNYIKLKTAAIPGPFLVLGNFEKH